MSGNINVGAGLVPALKFKFLLTASCKTLQNLRSVKMECETALWLFHFSK